MHNPNLRKKKEEEELSPDSSTLSAWMRLGEEVPFAGDTAEDTTESTPESDQSPENTPETPGLNSPADVLSDIKSYDIINGKIFSKESGQEITDEDTVLRVKTSRFLFNEAAAKKREQQHAHGDRFRDQGPAFFVANIMQRYGINDETNNYGTNKAMHSLLDSNGHLETAVTGFDPSFQFLTDPRKQDYATAMLRYKFRQKGQDFNNIQIKDTPDSAGGYINLSVNFDLHPLESSTPESSPSSTPDAYHHPAADQLNQLQQQYREALANNDPEAAEYFRASMRNAVEQNPANVTPDEWDHMPIEQRRDYVRTKMREAQLLDDQDAFNYWRANFNNLNNFTQPE